MSVLMHNMDLRAGLTNSTPVEVHVLQFDDLRRTVTADIALHNPVPTSYFIDAPHMGSAECSGDPGPGPTSGDDAASMGTYDMAVDCNGTVTVACPGGDAEAFFDYACPIRQQVTAQTRPHKPHKPRLTHAHTLTYEHTYIPTYWLGAHMRAGGR